MGSGARPDRPGLSLPPDPRRTSTGTRWNSGSSSRRTIDYRPPASEISFTFEGASVIGDPDHADSTDHYKLAVIPRILGHVSFADGMEFVVDAPHDLYLVRGDAAVLASGQDASADRWYVRRWEDRSPALVGLLPASPVTIGGIKAAYLQ